MTSKDYELCDNCDKPISFGPKGWVHEDSDQMMCERAEPKTEGIRRWLEAEKKQWDDAASKLPSAPSPAGETASGGNKPCFNCGCESIGKSLKGKGLPLCLTHFDMAIVAGWEPQLYAELGGAVPEPVPTEGGDELLASVMHLWVDGYIGKSPDSSADESISSGVFEKVFRYLEAQGIEVDYAGWRRVAQPAAPIAPAAEELRDPNYVHMKILRGEIALTKAQAIHIAGLPADVEERLKPAASPVAGVSAAEIQLTDRCAKCGDNRLQHAARYAHDHKFVEPSAEGDGWIAVTPENLPEEGEKVMAYRNGVYALGYRSQLLEVENVYWRPLPSPPEAK